MLAYKAVHQISFKYCNQQLKVLRKLVESTLVNFHVMNIQTDKKIKFMNFAFMWGLLGFAQACPSVTQALI